MLHGKDLVMIGLAILLRLVVRCFPFANLLFVVHLLTVTASAQSITLPAKEIQLEQLIVAIQKQTRFLVLYDTTVFRHAKRVDVGVTRGPVKDILESFFSGQPMLQYEIVKRNIGISLKSGVRTYIPVNEEQQHIREPFFVTGKAEDELGNALEGITVSIKGSTNSTSTDARGAFKLNAIDKNAVLVFSAVNIVTQELRMNGQQQMLATLSRKVIDMADVEVVSTGYQDIRRNSMTGSFVKIDNELLNRRAGPSILQRITDITPGLLFNRTGRINLLDDITLRGISTINASRRPLLVVDNFIYEGDINAININDVESITVLKDAAAASVWGVRSGNGVIVINLKKGKYKQRPQLSLRTELVVGNKPDLFYIPSIPSRDIIALERKRFAAGLYNDYDDLYPFYNSFESIPLVPEILLQMRRGEITAAEAEEKLRSLEEHDIRKDIRKYLLQNSVTTQQAINLSGGGKKFRYFGSMGYLKGQPETVNISDEQLTIRFANSWKVFKNLEIGAEFNGSRWTNYNKNSLERLDNYLTNPYQPLADEAGNALDIPKDYRLPYIDSVHAPGLLDWTYRPLEEARNGNRVTVKDNSRIAGYVNYTVFKGLTASANYQWQKESGQLKDIRSQGTYFTRNLVNRYVQTDINGDIIYPIPYGSIYNETNNKLVSWNFRSQLNFDRRWGDHSLTALAGFESREAKYESIRSPQQYGLNEATGQFSPVLYGRWKIRTRGTSSILKEMPADTQRTIDRYGSYYVNMLYSFKNRYNISASSRIDKSNYFGRKSNEEIKPLWHIGAGWEISKEPFFALDWISFLRLRATYGYNGNTYSGISPSARGEYFPVVPPLFVPIAAIISSPNAKLRWERVRTTNLALDFALLNKRLSGSIEWYKKTGIDLITSMPADPTSGFSAYMGNNARVSGKGMDINLSSKNLVAGFQWQTTLLLAYNSEKVSSYRVLPDQLAGVYLQNPVIPGRPLDYLSSLQWAGLDPLTGDARLIVNGQVVGSSDLDKASPGDVVYSGRTTPSWFGSFRNDFSWKNFAFSFNIVYKLGYVFRRSSFSGYMSTDFIRHNTWQHIDYVNAWQKPGDELFTDVPGFLEAYTDKRYEVYAYADMLVERGDHIRLQDIRISYELPASVVSRLKLSGVSFYTYCNNIGILWRANHYKIDPEAASFGTVPQPRTIAVGMNIVL